MTPFAFGPPSRRLTGLFHPAERSGAAGDAVLVCPPWGHEAMRSQRFFRVLADRLTRAGFAVLRFDYHGTGDSPGDDLDGEMEGWRQDVGAAHAELWRLSGAPRIHWLGARLGATLALRAAHEPGSAPTRLLLWDPVVDGPRYLHELHAAHVHALEASLCVPDRTLRRQLGQTPEAFPEGLLGTALSARLLQQLRGIAPAHVTASAVHDTVVLARAQDAPVAQWVGAQRARELPVTLLPLQHGLAWTSEPQPNNAMVPAEALQRLLAELKD